MITITKEDIELVVNQVWIQVENQVENQVWNQVENQVGNQVWNQVRDQVYDNNNR